MSESAAKQRAAARREAILNARGNRLSKLTSSARGDAAAALYEDTPSPIRSSPAAAELLGEEPSINMPRPSPSPTPASRRTSRLYRSSPAPQEDVSSAIPPEQEAMMRALLASMGGAAAAPGLPSLAPGLTPPGINTPTAGGPAASADPFAAILAQMTAQQQLPASSSDGGSLPNPLAAAFGSSAAGPAESIAVAPKPKTLFQKLVPLLHALSVLCLLAYFVFKWEPSAYEAGSTGGGTVPGSMSLWSRWSSLVGAKSEQSGIQAVPIFAAFTTLQIILHSIRIYNEPPPQPPSGILGMVISNLPPPFPKVIHTTLKYFQMGGAVMDDLSVLVFAVGVIVWGAGLFAVP